MSWAGITVAVIGGAVAVGTTWYSSEQSKIEGKKQRQAQAEAEARQSKSSEIDPIESASRKMFRQGLFFTSPTGIGAGTGTRGRSRLMGA